MDDSLRMDEIMTSTEVVEVYDLNTLNTFTLPKAGIADRHGMPHDMISTERYFSVEEVIRVGEILFRDGNLDGFRKRLDAKLDRIRAERYGDFKEWLLAPAISDLFGITRERVYQVSDYRGGSKIKTIQFGRIRLFWKEDVIQAFNIPIQINLENA